MFSKHTITSLVDVLFKDMKQDFKVYEEAQEEVDFYKVEESGGGGQQVQEGDEVGEGDGGAAEDSQGELDDQLIDYAEGRDIEHYMDVKSMLYIEKIKDIVGEIMGSCQKQLKYEILEYIMIGVIFEQKMLRESFMQELLKAADNAAFRQSLQFYLNANDMTVRGYFQNQIGNPNALDGGATPGMTPGSLDAQITPKKDGQRGPDRILAISWVDMSLQQLSPNSSEPLSNMSKTKRSGEYKVRLLVVTNWGIQLLERSPVSCKRGCPIQNFCPRGPTPDFCLLYTDISAIISHPQMPQKLTFLFYALQPGLFELTVNVPTYTKCSRIYNLLIEIRRGIESDEIEQP